MLAAILHFEGAENLGPDPGALGTFYEAGLRSLGLVWSRPNAYGHGVTFRFPASPETGPGLTGGGKELIRGCNRFGVLVDLSHLNERGFWDAAALSEAPLVTTHFNAHALCPSARNLTDRQLGAIRDSGSIVGVNFAIAFLREDGRDDEDTPLETVVRATWTTWWSASAWTVRASARTSTGRRFRAGSGTYGGSRSCSGRCASAATTTERCVSSHTRTGSVRCARPGANSHRW